MLSDQADSDIRGNGRSGKSPEAFSTISEVSAKLDVPQHVLRFWESKFPQIKPLKRGGGRRYYRPEDLQLLQTIRGLLYADGYTIKGVQKLFREQGVKAVVTAPKPDAPEETAVHEAPPVAAEAIGPVETPNLAVSALVSGVIGELAMIRDSLLELADDKSE